MDFGVVLGSSRDQCFVDFTGAVEDGFGMQFLKGQKGKRCNYCFIFAHSHGVVHEGLRLGSPSGFAFETF